MEKISSIHSCENKDEAFTKVTKRKRHRKKKCRRSKSDHRGERNTNACIFDIENCEICIRNNYFDKLSEIRQNCRHQSNESDVIYTNMNKQTKPSTSKKRKKRKKKTQKWTNSDNADLSVSPIAGSNLCSESCAILDSETNGKKTLDLKNDNWEGKSRSWRKRHRKEMFMVRQEMKYCATMGVFKLWNIIIEKEINLHSQRIQLQGKDSKILQLSKTQLFYEDKINNLLKNEEELLESMKKKEQEMNELRRDYEYIQGLLEDNTGLTIDRDCLDDIQQNILESVTMINSLANMIHSREV